MKYEKARARAEALVSQMTLEEKAAQTLHIAPGIERLGIKPYTWWNEALHGVARAGLATMFPQAIGLAATFHGELIRSVADAISTEGRAKYNEAQKQGDCGIYKGLTYWSPNVNIFRDPRWGRGHETYGEDPFLTGRIGEQFVKGLQGDGDYLKASACAKHYAVHSGPEESRHEFNAEISKQEMFDTYMPAFEHLVREASVTGVMGAYNRINGEPCCGSLELINGLLREEWGFQGYFVSDCGALADFHEHHHVTASETETAALAMNCGCDLNCGEVYRAIPAALQAGLLAEETLDKAVTRLFAVRIMLGEFDITEWDGLGYESLCSPEHRALNLEAAEQSVVLLQNKKSFLPLNPDEWKTVAVIGPNADSRRALEGNYCGTAEKYITLLDGICESFPKSRVLCSEGCHLYRDRMEPYGDENDRRSEAVSMAEASDLVIACVGLDASMEGEQGDAGNAYASGDRPDWRLPVSQRKLLRELAATGKPLVIVTLAGGCIDLEDGNEAEAVLHAWYPGALGGRAIGRILTGAASPSGRLPITFYRADAKLPPFENYHMEGRTYRYYRGEPLYPFGYGLGYSTFSYSGLTLERDSLPMGENLCGWVTVRNTGDRKASEVVQLYLKRLSSRLSAHLPNYSLCGFENIELQPGESRRLEFAIASESMAVVDSLGKRRIEPGRLELYAGGQQPDARSGELTGNACLKTEFKLERGELPP